MNDIDTKNLSVLNKQREDIKYDITEIKQIIDKLKKLLNINDARLAFAYKLLNSEFKRLP